MHHCYNRPGGHTGYYIGPHTQAVKRQYRAGMGKAACPAAAERNAELMRRSLKEIEYRHIILATRWL